mmetsp:Transcript_7887/g.19330  ORF Transcript_7887/g.19330 Transcript_7887/m.19330 type:complete len:403 (-) Transcript_7887:1063-2271(-)
MAAPWPQDYPCGARDAAATPAIQQRQRVSAFAVVWALVTTVAFVGPWIGSGSRQLGLPARLKRNDLRYLLGKRVRPIPPRKKRYFNEETARKQRCPKVDLFIQEAMRFVEKNLTDLAVDSLTKLRREPLTMSLKSLRNTIRVLAKLRRLMGHPDPRIVLNVRKCVRSWRRRFLGLQHDQPATLEPSSSEDSEDLKNDSKDLKNDRLFFAHTHGHKNITVCNMTFTRNESATCIYESIKDCFRHSEPPKDFMMWEYALNVEFYLYSLQGPTYEYVRKVTNICCSLRNIHSHVRDLIRSASLTPEQLCHMNHEGAQDTEADDMMYALIRKRRREEIAAIRAEYDKKMNKSRPNLYRPKIYDVLTKREAQVLTMSINEGVPKLPKQVLESNEPLSSQQLQLMKGV